MPCGKNTLKKFRHNLRFSEPNMFHTPVMSKEILEVLAPAPGKKYIDCTLGDGGHSLLLLKEGASVLGLDVSTTSVSRAFGRIESENLGKNFVCTKGNFKNIEEIASQIGFFKVDGILFDLGYSSSQLDEEDTGMSFINDQPLDMRLDKSLTVTAADLINVLNEKQLSDLIYSYSDERMAKKFAKAIVSHRGLKKFHTTKDLADLLKSEAPLGYEHGRIHPATRTFQALRIAVNNEIENLQLALPQAARLLLPGGRVAALSFHSLEDKVLKDFGRSAQSNLKSLTPKPLSPSTEEIQQNPRARSAKLRAYEKTAHV